MKIKFWRELFSDQRITGYYVDIGGKFGDVVSFVGSMGECIGFEKLLGKFEDWEKEYADRGYRTLSIDTFVGYGGWGRSIDHLVSIKREVDEQAILHAQLYKEHFLGKIEPMIDFEKMIQDGQAQVGHYIVPSTEMIIELEKQKNKNN